MMNLSIEKPAGLLNFTYQALYRTVSQMSAFTQMNALTQMNEFTMMIEFTKMN